LLVRFFFFFFFFSCCVSHRTNHTSHHIFEKMSDSHWTQARADIKALVDGSSWGFFHFSFSFSAFWRVLPFRFLPCLRTILSSPPVLPKQLTYHLGHVSYEHLVILLTRKPIQPRAAVPS
jgi:hypothetical protein